MMEDLCLRGKEIVRFRFYLRNNFSFEQAARQARNRSALESVRNEIMLAELRSRNNPLQLAAVQEKSSIYGQTFRPVFMKYLDAGYLPSVAANAAEKRADTIAACHPGTYQHQKYPYGERKDAFYIIISKVLYPAKKLKPKTFGKINLGLWNALKEIKYCHMLHILEWTFERDPGHIRAVCGNRETVEWLERFFPTLGLGKPFTLSIFPESKLMFNQVYSNTVYEVNVSAKKQTNKIVLKNFVRRHKDGRIERVDTSRWTLVSQQRVDERTIRLVVTLPQEPDGRLIQAANVLHYAKKRAVFTKRAINTIEDRVWRSLGVDPEHGETSRGRNPA